MKKSHLLIFTFFLLSFLAKLNGQTVYIAETGKKYHTKTCPAVKDSRKEMELKEARTKGYEPCTSCGAEKIMPKDEKPSQKKKEEKK